MADLFRPIRKLRSWWHKREAQKCLNTARFFLAHGEKELAQEYSLMALEHSAKAKLTEPTP
jgi:HEPN domain-containing protein